MYAKLQEKKENYLKFLLVIIKLIGCRISRHDLVVFLRTFQYTIIIADKYQCKLYSSVRVYVAAYDTNGSYVVDTVSFYFPFCVCKGDGGGSYADCGGGGKVSDPKSNTRCYYVCMLEASWSLWRTLEELHKTHAWANNFPRCWIKQRYASCYVIKLEKEKTIFLLIFFFFLSICDNINEYYMMYREKKKEETETRMKRMNKKKKLTNGICASIDIVYIYKISSKFTKLIFFLQVCFFIDSVTYIDKTTSCKWWIVYL